MATWAIGKAWPRCPCRPRARGRSVRMGWRKEGLYGALDVTDNYDRGRRACALGRRRHRALGREGPEARARPASTRNAAQFVFGPPASLQDGPALAQVVYGEGGQGAASIAAAWRKTQDGYRLEWFVPAAALAPPEAAARSAVGPAFRGERRRSANRAIVGHPRDHGLPAADGGGANSPAEAGCFMTQCVILRAFHSTTEVRMRHGTRCCRSGWRTHPGPRTNPWVPRISRTSATRTIGSTPAASSGASRC